MDRHKSRMRQSGDLTWGRMYASGNKQPRKLPRSAVYPAVQGGRKRGTVPKRDQSAVPAGEICERASFAGL